MGKLGNWITDGTGRPFYARRELEVRAGLAQATARVCGLGQFVLSANGAKVGDHELDPGWTDYRKYAEYVTFDLTSLLREGTNALGVEVGNGWFLKDDHHYTFSFPPFMPPNPNPYVPFGVSLMLAAELTLEYADGSREVLRADDAWRVAPHPVVRSNVYGSEDCDLRLAQTGWSEPGFDDGAWARAAVVPEAEEPAGELVEQFQPPVKVIHIYEGKLIGRVNGRIIYDFGQNASGMLCLSARGPEGAQVRAYPAEKLTPDGDVDQVAKGWVTVDNVVTVTLAPSDGWQDFRSTFAYVSGRYVAVEAPETVRVRRVALDAITSAWKRAGTFTCDDDRLNAIYAMVERTVEANMLSVHTDCPTIERFAWQEPNHLMAPAIMFMKNGRRLWEKFLLDMRMAQHGPDDTFRDLDGNAFPAGDGLVPSQAPCYIPNVLPVPGMGSFYDIIPWGSALILGARWHWRFYGDEQVIRSNYDAGMRYLAYLKTKVTPEGFINHGLGDWGNPDGECARENVETVFLYADAVALAEFAQALGKEEDERELRIFAERVRSNYNERLLVRGADRRWLYRVWEHGDEDVTTQAAEALPLYFGLVPQEAKDDVVQAFRQTLTDKGCFCSGEVGLPYIIQTAREHGMNDLIAQFILRKEHPSYYAFVMDGMTTLGEYWEKNPRSHCHDMMGHVIEWYYNGIAGIQPQAPGFAEVRIDPWMPPSVDEFVCTYEAPQGTIRVAGRRVEGKPVFEVDLPEGVKRI